MLLFQSAIGCLVIVARRASIDDTLQGFDGYLFEKGGAALRCFVEGDAQCPGKVFVTYSLCFIGIRFTVVEDILQLFQASFDGVVLDMG